MHITEKEIQRKIDTRTKPQGSLGILEKIAKKIALVQNTLTPELRNPTLFVCAADHGIADEGVSKYPKEVTYQMVKNYLNGGAACNVFCRQNHIHMVIVDAGVDYDLSDETGIIHSKIGWGTRNMLHEPAMTTAECSQSVDKGRELVREVSAKGCNVVGFGEMGIGNTTSASLLMNKIMGIPVEKCVGPGSGVQGEALKKKYEIIREVSEKYSISDPLEILATVGGYEIAMMCGGMMEAKKQGMLIMVDGFIATSALLPAYALDHTIAENCIFCHSSNEQGHRLMLEYLKGDPILHLDLRLGEGTGCAIAYPILKSAVTFLNEMSSFDEAGVSEGVA